MASKLRVYQVAKELNISHADIIEFCQKKKIEKIKTLHSLIDESVYSLILDNFQVEKKRAEQKVTRRKKIQAVETATVKDDRHHIECLLLPDPVVYERILFAQQRDPAVCTEQPGQLDRIQLHTAVEPGETHD